jgi:hypothetical protein
MTGACHNWRKIAISLIDTEKAEWKAHACAIACYRQFRLRITRRPLYKHLPTGKVPVAVFDGDTAREVAPES